MLSIDGLNVVWEPLGLVNIRLDQNVVGGGGERSDCWSVNWKYEMEARVVFVRRNHRAHDDDYDDADDLG